jgi:hypothetical protein
MPQERVEVRLASSTAFRLYHSTSVGFSSGAYAGSRSTTSHDRWVASQARIAWLPCAGSPSQPRTGSARLSQRRNRGAGLALGDQAVDYGKQNQRITLASRSPATRDFALRHSV